MTRTLWLLTAAVSMLCLAAPASAEFIYVWKTNECPVFPGVGPAVGQIAGVMQAPAVTDPADQTISTGGPYCDLVTATKTSAFGMVKVHKVLNADVVASAGDPGTALPGQVWDCVLCNYSKGVAGLPALSLLGTALLLGGLVTAAFYELRRRQGRLTAA